jgi:hypothetical protein
VFFPFVPGFEPLDGRTLIAAEYEDGRCAPSPPRISAAIRKRESDRVNENLLAKPLHTNVEGKLGFGIYIGKPTQDQQRNS